MPTGLHCGLHMPCICDKWWPICLLRRGAVGESPVSDLTSPNHTLQIKLRGGVEFRTCRWDPHLQCSSLACLMVTRSWMQSSRIRDQREQENKCFSSRWPEKIPLSAPTRKPNELREQGLLLRVGACVCGCMPRCLETLCFRIFGTQVSSSDHKWFQVN